MGVASVAKVTCGSETRDSHAISIQPGNREWDLQLLVFKTRQGACKTQHQDTNTTTFSLIQQPILLFMKDTSNLN